VACVTQPCTLQRFLAGLPACVGACLLIKGGAFEVQVGLRWHKGWHERWGGWHGDAAGWEAKKSCVDSMLCSGQLGASSWSPAAAVVSRSACQQQQQQQQLLQQPPPPGPADVRCAVNPCSCATPPPSVNPDTVAAGYSPAGSCMLYVRPA
jgi:hypothetical protein